MSEHGSASSVALVPVRGGWMAISAPGSTPRIAVIGETREDALRSFQKSRVEWERLAEKKSCRGHACTRPGQGASLAPADDDLLRRAFEKGDGNALREHFEASIRGAHLGKSSPDLIRP